MSTEQTTGEIKPTRDVKTVSMSEQPSRALLLLMLLILVETGDMAMLGYKFETHRDSNDRGSLRGNACEAPRKTRGSISTSLICGLGRPPTEAVLRHGRARTAPQAIGRHNRRYCVSRCISR